MVLHSWKEGRGNAPPAYEVFLIYNKLPPSFSNKSIKAEARSCLSKTFSGKQSPFSVEIKETVIGAFDRVNMIVCQLQLWQWCSYNYIVPKKLCVRKKSQGYLY